MTPKELLDYLLREPERNRARTFLESMPSTTAALCALAAVLRRDLDDAPGAALVLAFAEKYAEHEAPQL